MLRAVYLKDPGCVIAPKGWRCHEPLDAAKRSPVLLCDGIASPGAPGSQ
jgi:hypothetical protein